MRTLTTALLMMIVCARVASAADPALVFVDARDPAFVVLQGIAQDASAQTRSEMTGYSTLEGVSLVTWSQFRQNAQAIIAPYVVKDEYPGASSILGVVALVKAYPGEPFGVTWNGGLAVTFHDYQYAVKTYKAFRADAQAYEESRPADPATDPVHPENHLAVLLKR